MILTSKDFDSIEEYQFYNWLLEAEQNQLITDIEYHHQTYQLSPRQSVWVEKKLKTKTKTIERFLLHPHSYTPDFRFKAQNMLIFPFFEQTSILGGGEIIIDVKGVFAGRNNTTATTFPLNQKFMYSMYGVYVQKVVPEKLFKKTFVPEVARRSPVKKHPVRKYVGVKSIKEFIQMEG